MEDDHPLIERKNTKFRITVEPAGFLFFVASIVQVV